MILILIVWIRAVCTRYDVQWQTDSIHVSPMERCTEVEKAKIKKNEASSRRSMYTILKAQPRHSRYHTKLDRKLIK